MVRRRGSLGRSAHGPILTQRKWKASTFTSLQLDSVGGLMRAAIRSTLMILGLSTLAVGFAVHSVTAQGPAEQRLSSRAFAADAAEMVAGIRTADFKDPNTATLLSVLITGGGQFWAGDTGRGLLLFGVGNGAVLGGCLITANTGSSGLCAAGALVWLGTWVYGIVDAAPTARRMNQQRGAVAVSLRPLVTAAGSSRVGLAMSVRF